jgi:serine/threonine protein kinase/dipeptidyl aminopeptidase/acylaminoacyl peptidase
MTHPNWSRAKQVFNEALEKTGQERTAFVVAACGDDAELRSQVDALLTAHVEAGEFLASPTGAGADAAARAVAEEASNDPPEGPGTQIGPYKLLQLIGEGGFGTVYMADQVEPIRRRVALKIIKLGMDTKEVIARFESERQALAMMDHPNIARVLDAGATESGRPYFVMELVKGVPITEYCDANRLSTRERLDLFVDLCKAVHHAHEKGIIHRDIKPSNVMVTLHDGTPVPKVIDFGIAKATNQPLTEKTLFTAYGQFLGTPTYMSPEQAALGGLEIDRRCDVYSLGVLLYELLTGTTPFEHEALRSRAFMEVMRIIREDDPPTPSARLNTLGERLSAIATSRHVEPNALAKLVRGDLDWIVMRAIEKDRRRRYNSAAEFAADVSRYFNDQPVIARPPSAAYRTRKFARRRKGPLVAVTAVVGAIVLVVTVTRFGPLRPAASTGHAAVPPIQRQVTFLGDVGQAAISRDGRSIVYGNLERGPFTNLFVRNIDGGEPIRIARVELLTRVEWSPDGTTLLVSGILGDSGRFGIYVIPRFGGAPRRLAVDSSPVLVSWSSDGRRIGAGWTRSGKITITEVATSTTTTIDSGYKSIQGVAWSSLDRLAIRTFENQAGTVYVLDIAKRSRQMAFADTSLGGWLDAMEWTTAGDAIYYGGLHGGLRRVQIAADGRASSPPELLLSDRPWFFTLTADGQRMLYVRRTAHVNLRAVMIRTGSPAQVESRELTTGTAVHFGPAISPDGRWIIVGRGPYLFRMSVDGGTPSQVTSSDKALSAPAWSPDGLRVAFGMKDKEGRSGLGIVESTGGPVRFVSTEGTESADEVAWAPSPWIVYASRDFRNFDVVDPSTGQSRKLLDGSNRTGDVYRPRVSPDGRRLAFVRWEGGSKPEEAWVVRLSDGVRLAAIPFPDGHDFIGWAADGSALHAVTSKGDTLVRVSLPNGRMTPIVKLPEGCNGWTVSPMVRDRIICSVRSEFRDAWLIENFGAVAGAQRR